MSQPTPPFNDQGKPTNHFQPTVRLADFARTIAEEVNGLINLTNAYPGKETRLLTAVLNLWKIVVMEGREALDDLNKTLLEFTLRRQKISREDRLRREGKLQ